MSKPLQSLDVPEEIWDNPESEFHMEESILLSVWSPQVYFSQVFLLIAELL